MARKERSASAQGRRSHRSLRQTAELQLSTGSEDGAACFDSFDNVGARDDTLARIRELAADLGASFEGHAVSVALSRSQPGIASFLNDSLVCPDQTSYELSITTSKGEDDGLTPSSTEIAIQLTGSDASSEEILCRSPNRESVCPGATLKLHYERRAAEDPFGELVRTPCERYGSCTILAD